MNPEICLDFINFQAVMLKKNNITKNPALLVSAQFADSKPENKTKNKKIKSTLKYTLSSSFFPFCWVVKKEKTTLLFESSLFIMQKESGPNPQNAPGGNPKKKPNSLSYVAISS